MFVWTSIKPWPQFYSKVLSNDDEIINFLAKLLNNLVPMQAPLLFYLKGICCIKVPYLVKLHNSVRFPELENMMVWFGFWCSFYLEASGGNSSCAAGSTRSQQNFIRNFGHGLRFWCERESNGALQRAFYCVKIFRAFTISNQISFIWHDHISI